MAQKTNITWTESTWNPISGCTRISDGCLNCYIERTPPFRIEHRRFDGPNIGATTGVRLHPGRLGQPSGWRKPRMVFVCSLADLFHAEVPSSSIAEVWAEMSLSPQHTFQVLTKRHGRMRALLRSGDFWELVSAARILLGAKPLPNETRALLNVWLGVTAESQQWAETRIPVLLDTPAVVRWVSAEPLLSPLDLTCCGGVNALGRDWTPTTGTSHPLLDWVVVGGESGGGARPLDLEWVRGVVTQCQDATVPVFVKQLGAVWARDTRVGGVSVARYDKAGSDMSNWPAGLRIREYPQLSGVVAS
jgi:protein gp37